MDRDFEYALLAIGAVIIFAGKKLVAMSNKAAVIDAVKAFLPYREGFSATPYWDVSRWSWGYGTAAPGPDGSITRDAAMNALVDHVLNDYTRLYGAITRTLSANQWAALLSFSYNLGPGNALNLVPYINAGNYQELGIHWNKYIYAGGKVNQGLVERRALEWDLFTS